MKKLIIKSCCKYTLKSYISFLDVTLKHLNSDFSIFFLPTTERKLTLLKSPHVNKKAKEQFKISTHKVVISINNFDTSKFTKHISFFILNKPKAVSIKIKS
jgi:small subunit ribosomal protein S10